jgi:environmental stress-induced protein Ves
LGERPLEGRLIDGPILDFNVMTRRDVARAALRIVGPSQGRSSSSCGLLFVVRGSVHIADHDGNAAVLRVFECFEPDSAIQISTSADAAAFVVEN